MNDLTSAALIAQNPAIQPLLTRYCQHTGKPVGIVSHDEFAELLKIHGIETTKTILEYTQKGYAPEWIWQNAEGLEHLALWQPKEYFIFAMSKLMFPADSRTIVPAEARLDLAFQRKVQAWQNVQAIDIEIVKPVAELCRRIIAKCNPNILQTVLCKCQQTDVAIITSSLDNMMAFHLELEDLCKWLVENLAKLEASEKRGLQNFSGQHMIIGLSKLEREVCQEMNDFELIPDKSPDTVEMLVGKRYAKTAKKKKQAYSCKPLTLSGEQTQSVPKLAFKSATPVESVAQPIAKPAETKPAFKPTFSLPKGDK